MATSTFVHGSLRTFLSSLSASRFAGRQMEDGAGMLADGTRFERSTTEEYGPDGYWLRQTVMRGVSGEGKVSGLLFRLQCGSCECQSPGHNCRVGQGPWHSAGGRLHSRL